MSATPLRAIVVDDEPLARRHLRTILSADTAVRVVGECRDGLEAVRAIATLAPDLALLDVQMPELDGFGVVSQVGPERMPAVIFVTAHDAYAARAFDVHAVDYVLKPVDPARLLRAVERTRTYLASGAPGAAAARAESLHALLSTMRGGVPAERIAVKVDGRHVFIATATIDWVQAVDDYVRIHVARTAYLVRATLQGVEARLPRQFMRIHRSIIVNTERVREIAPTDLGDYRITLHDGTRLQSGRSYRAAVAEFVSSASLDRG